MAIDIVVADDLTGAADTVVQFLPVAERVLVFPSLRRFQQAVDHGLLPPGDLAIAISTESRHVSPAEAARHVRLAHHIALKLDPRLLFQKVDSALRGNPGAELAAFRAATGAATVLMTPAFPPSRRTVRGGVLYVGGMPLAASEVQRDPRTPAGESFIPALLRRQTELSIELLPLPAVRDNATQLAASLRRLAAGIAVADAETPADLDAIARAATDTGLLHAISGSAGLAGGLSALLPRSKAERPGALPPADRRVLAIIGSPHPVARSQAERAAGRIVTLPVEQAGNGIRPARGEAAAQLAAALEQDRLAILRPPPLDDGVPAAGAAEAMATALAGVAAGLLADHLHAAERPVQAIVVSGGDVAAALCEQLHTEYLELAGQVFPGAPLGILRGGFGNGLPIVTKSGAHGDENGLVQIAAHLRRGAATPGARQSRAEGGE